MPRSARSIPRSTCSRPSTASSSRGALRDAIGDSSAEDRTLLRQQIVDQPSIDEVGAAFGVHRATAARWLTRARAALVGATHKRLAERLQLPVSEIERDPPRAQPARGELRVGSARRMTRTLRSWMAARGRPNGAAASRSCGRGDALADIDARGLVKRDSAREHLHLRRRASLRITPSPVVRLLLPRDVVASSRSATGRATAGVPSPASTSRPRR